MMKRKPFIAVLVMAVTLLLTALTSTAVPRDSIEFPTLSTQVNEPLSAMIGKWTLNTDVPVFRIDGKPCTLVSTSTLKHNSPQRMVPNVPDGFKEVGSTGIFAGTGDLNYYYGVKNEYDWGYLDLYTSKSNEFSPISYRKYGLSSIIALDPTRGETASSIPYNDYYGVINEDGSMWVAIKNDSTGNRMLEYFQKVIEHNDEVLVTYIFINCYDKDVVFSVQADLTCNFEYGSKNYTKIQRNNYNDGIHSFYINDIADAEWNIYFDDSVTEYWFGDSIQGNWGSDYEAAGDILESSNFPSLGFIWLDYLLKQGEITCLSFVVSTEDVNEPENVVIKDATDMLWQVASQLVFPAEKLYCDGQSHGFEVKEGFEMPEGASVSLYYEDSNGNKTQIPPCEPGIYKIYLVNGKTGSPLDGPSEKYNYRVLLVYEFEIVKGNAVDFLEQVSQYAVLPSEDVTYDGLTHGICWEEGFEPDAATSLTVIYENASGNRQTDAPKEAGRWKIYLSTAGSDVYEDAELKIHEFEIYKIDAGDMDMLKAIAKTIVDSGAELPFNVDDLPALVNNNDRVFFRKGRVVILDLSGLHITVPDPTPQVAALIVAALKLTALEEVSIADNGFGGDIEALGQAILNKLLFPFSQGQSNAPTRLPSFIAKLQRFDMSVNAFSGNIGALGKVLTSLTSLTATDNCLSRVEPALPESCTEAHLERQHMGNVMEIELSKLNKETLKSAFPNLLAYDNATHSYTKPVTVLMADTTLSALDTERDWAMIMDYDQSRGDNDVILSFLNDNKVYTGRNGAELHVYSLNPGDLTPDGSDFKATFKFAQGDANFDGKIDVTDVQSILLWMFGEYPAEYPFNLTAADTKADQTINVQDIVVAVNLLLAQTLDNQGQEWRVPALGAEVDARIWTEDGTVWLESQTPVAAIQLNHDGEIEWTLAELGMSVSTADGAMVAWSPTLSEIPAGRHAIGRVSSAVGRIAARCADRQARALRTAASTDLTTGAEASAADRDVRHIGLDGLQGDDSEVIINITRDGVTKQINTNRNKR